MHESEAKNTYRRGQPLQTPLTCRRRQRRVLWMFCGRRWRRERSTGISQRIRCLQDIHSEHAEQEQFCDARSIPSGKLHANVGLTSGADVIVWPIPQPLAPHYIQSSPWRRDREEVGEDGEAEEPNSVNT